MKSRFVSVACLTFGLTLILNTAAAARDRWTAEQANAWYAEQPWLAGCNFIPSTAINQLEMWQEDSFDPETIERHVARSRQPV